MTTISMSPPDSNLTPARIQDLAADAWGLLVRAEPLVGFADENFRLTTDRGERFVLKIAPPDTSLEWLQCQISAMLRLAASPLAALVPRVVPTLSEEVVLRLNEESDDPRRVRLLTYLEGSPLAKVTRRPPLLLEEIGRTLAQLDSALADFDHPGAHYEFFWDTMTIPGYAQFATHIDDPSRRSLVEDHLRRFETHVTPRSSELGYTVIHNDGNDYNLLVSTSGGGAPRLSGLIDFGDVIYTATISEIAVSCAYLMGDRDEPWRDAGHLIRGYNSVRPLTHLERELLPDLIIGRICASLMSSAHGRHSNPDNAYIQISEAPMWRLLEKIAMDHRNSLADAVETACR